MKVTISPDMERFVDEQVQSGRYQTPAEVLRAALQTLQAQELLRQIRLEQLRQEVEIGLEDIRRGRSAPLDVEAIKGEGPTDSGQVAGRVCLMTVERSDQSERDLLDIWLFIARRLDPSGRPVSAPA